MSGKICRCTIFAFRDGESYKGEYYGNSDLENGIQFCLEHIEDGQTHEYHDKFDLKDYIIWAKEEISKEPEK